jgi:hypothetical protein
MGYAHEGICSEPGCKAMIDHGLSYVCGGMHQGGAHGCGDYYCTKHLRQHWIDDDNVCGEACCQLCSKCSEEEAKG